MTAVLDFATLPPEINSARMYTGPGSAPMLAAASAWQGLAAELRATALSYGSVLTALTGEEWYGPASAAMAAAATPYVTWMSTTAVQAEQTAVQAQVAAAAYEAAFAATVPPPVIAANRAQLMALIATNILGQNTPAIAATEAQYAEMWAQDAGAMYGYAGSSASATQLTPFIEPQQTTNTSGLAAQAVSVAQASGQAAGSMQSTLSQLISEIPNALQGLASSSPLGSGSLWNEFGPNANFWNTVASSGLMVPGSTFGSFLSLIPNTAAADAAGNIAEAIAPSASAVTGPLGTGGLGSAISAAMGNGRAVGTLSVPPSWAGASPLASPLASTLGGTPMIAPDPAMAGSMPPVPFGAGAQGFGRAVPQYGFKPSFVVRPPAAG
jgi:PPE-repeat protein